MGAILLCDEHLNTMYAIETHTLNSFSKMFKHFEQFEFKCNYIICDKYFSYYLLLYVKGYISHMVKIFFYRTCLSTKRSIIYMIQNELYIH